MSGLINYAWLVPLLPLLGAVTAAAFGRQLGQRAHWPVWLGIGGAFVVSALLLTAAGKPGTTVVYDWLDVTGLDVPVTFRVDGLTTMMLAMVTFVATLVAVYAAGYMAGDPGYPRFFAVVGLFVFSMTGLVLSSNYVLTYAFWEGVGVCSYLLVGFWHAKPAAAAAAKKAFLVNRIGDFGFAIALFWMWSAVQDLFAASLPQLDHLRGLVESQGYLAYDVILDPAVLGLIPHETKLGIALLLFWAATAKSAQIPLYVWLPDAMEGPTPVSALIHAATMVTAGVYLIARSSALIAQVPEAQLLISIVGCATALLAALIALTQTDLKRVMAYSTVSQLGYMFMALGAGVGDVAQFAVIAGMFHLFTHAFFKALLFLASGSVMHAMGGVIDMRRFRGLKHRLPYTCGTFAVGGLALSGIFPTAGFWSKDEVLTSLKLASKAAGAPLGHGAQIAYLVIYWVAVFTAFLTAFYTGRAFFLTFFGPEKLPSPDDPEADPGEAHGHAHGHGDHALPATPALPHGLAAAETPQAAEYQAVMGTAASSASHGDHGGSPHAPAGESRSASDEPVPAAAGHGHGHGHDDHFGHESPPLMWVPLVILAVCALAVGLIFGPTHWFEHHLEATPGFDRLGHFEHEHGFDMTTALIGTAAGVAGLVLAWWMYAAPKALPGRLARSFGPLYRASYRKFYVDELYDLVVIAPTRLLAAISKFVDTYIVDGLVRLAAWAPRFVGREALSPLQNGLVQFYAASTALGVVLLLWVVILMR